jgi:GMP synthase (glutamine-hydrolysing)
MRTTYVIKLGTTFAALKERWGDFDAWTVGALGSVDTGVRVLDVPSGAALPPAAGCAGVVVTGSHAMVTDQLPWSRRVEAWIPALLEARVPFLGICYGHQLLAQATGGRVGFHPRGPEIGTVAVERLPGGDDDPLFRSLPPRFSVHATHAQTVLRLPPGAVPLARNAHEPHHAFRLGDRAWGVQFHPEFSVDVMRAYVEAQAGTLAAAGRDVAHLARAVEETPCATQVIRNFARLIAGHDPPVRSATCPAVPPTTDGALGA